MAHRSIDVRFGPLDYDRLRSLLDSPTFSPKEVTKLRAKALQSPEAPSEALLKMLEEAEPVVYKTQAKPQPSRLLKTLAAAREDLRGAVFANTVDHGDAAYLFLFAQVSPTSLHFLVLEKDDCVLPAAQPSGHNSAGQHSDPSQAWFPFRWKSTDRVITDQALDMHEDMVVFLGAFFFHGVHVVADGEPMNLGDLVQRLPKQSKAEATAEHQERKQAKRAVDADMMAAHPWLEEYVGKAKKRRGAPPAGAIGAADTAAGEAEEAPAEASDPVEVDLAAVYAEVAKNKALYEVTDVGGDGGFVTRVRGGLWTAVHTGRATDCIKGACTGGLAADFCRRFGLNREASFATRTYSHDGASFLANAWVHRMQWMFQLWLEKGTHGDTLSEEDLAAYQEDPAFQDWVSSLGADAAAHGRITQIRGLRPKKPVK